jgi:hypothetical protein
VLVLGGDGTSMVTVPAAGIYVSAATTTGFALKVNVPGPTTIAEPAVVSVATTRPVESEIVTAALAPAGRPARATSMRFCAAAAGGPGDALSLPPLPQPASERPMPITARTLSH